MGHTHYTRDIAAQIVSMYATGMTYDEIERTLGIPNNIIAAWRYECVDDGYLTRLLDDTMRARRVSLAEKCTKIASENSDKDLLYWTDKDGVTRPYGHNACIGRANVKLKALLAHIGRIDMHIEDALDIRGFSALPTSSEMLCYLNERYESGRLTPSQYDRLLKAVELKSRSEETERLRDEVNEIKRLIEKQNNQL